MRSVAILLLLVLTVAATAVALGQSDTPEPPPDVAPPPGEETYERRRNRLVEQSIAGRGISDEAVIRAMRTVPRHEFVPPSRVGVAYQDRPLPIGHGQTISQPYIVAYMTEILDVDADDTVLEVGTGSGYQAAVLAEIVNQVYTVEIIEPLAEQARERFEELGYENVHTKAADGYYGWEEHAPFDAVIVTAAAGHVPPPLVNQLDIGGTMVIPVGRVYEVQTLIKITKQADGSVVSEELLPVRFVPLTGAGQSGGE
jgi:protein-L-isoaspartate(D-aspartate) O-methyltransferase